MTEFYASPDIALSTVEGECAYEGGCATEDVNSCGPGGPDGGGGEGHYDEGIAGWFKDLFRPGADLVSFITTFLDLFNYLF